MQGTVMAFSHELRVGYISGDDGQEYIFSDHHWRLNTKPCTALKVCFETVRGEVVNVTRN